MWLWLKSRWYRRLRRIDVEILWPQCVRLAEDPDSARAAFARHALHDKAWLFLGEQRVIEIIDKLELRV